MILTKTYSWLHYVNYMLCLPVILLVNFSLFQYLFVTYFARRREWRAKAIIISAFIGFATLVTFSYANDNFVSAMNDISEVCTVLTFLIQITIIGRDVLKRVKVRSVRYMTYTAEFLIVLGLVVILINIVDLAIPQADTSWLHTLDHISENVGLAFVLVFRFHYTAMLKSWTRIWQRQKLEFILYLLFTIHKYPFYILQLYITWNAEYIQGLVMRLLMAACLSITIHERYLSSVNSRHQQPSSDYHGPSMAVAPELAAAKGPAPNAKDIAVAKSRGSVGNAQAPTADMIRSALPTKPPVKK